MRSLARIIVVLVAAGLTTGAAAAQDARLGIVPGSAADVALDLFSNQYDVRQTAIARLLERNNSDSAAALIQAIRFIRDPGIFRVPETVTGVSNGTSWNAWMLWQEAHPEIVPFENFAAFKANVMAKLDPAFRLFLRPGIAHTIRLEEIAWGGVIKDGIPALVNPALIAADEAGYLDDGEQVFGVAINGDVRAYPLRIMDWHEMFNDVIGGVPVALAYCTLCGSGILYDTRVEGRAEPFVFGSSGFLYRSNKLMYDQATHSLWNQFTGEPVVGPLTGSGIELKILPVAITTWAKWRQRHPDTKVLSLETGYVRDYRPGRPYGTYFASPGLMFPALVPDDALAPKDQVFVLRDGGAEKAWRLSAFEGGQVVNDTLSGRPVVLIGDAASRTVRAYVSGGRVFAAGADEDHVMADGVSWRLEEHALIAEDGERLERLAGHIAYWFAWANFRRGAELAD